MLNPDQERALRTILDALNARRHQTILIHGVTGSGKTEVYIQAIQEVIHFGRQAIVLVPEISLTPQTVERFRQRFGAVAVLHSHLSDAERHWHWQRIADGRGVGGGRRPQRDLRPHAAPGADRAGRGARDVVQAGERAAVSRPRRGHGPGGGRRDSAGAGLGHAVAGELAPGADGPVSRWWRCRGGCWTGRCRRWARSTCAASRAAARSRGAISRQLHAAMHAALDEGGQVILLLNRRGFSTHIQCPACGHVVRCPRVRHRPDAPPHASRSPCATTATTRCRRRRPARSATSPASATAGLGTQRLEAEVRARFPNVLCLRMDTDTMQAHGSHERALAAFRSGKVRILLGTQMIAKGLDFPNVTLVGVINADTALHLPDFRAAERTFHLVTQVAGRTGRGPKGGRVLVQTFSPDHPAIQAAVRHDYAAFAAGELAHAADAPLSAVCRA